MSYLLTEEQELIQQNAREFAREYLEPIACELDKSGEYPVAVVQKMAEHNFFGLFLPIEFEGIEAGYLSYVLAVEELSKASAAVASILTSHAAAAYAINRWGTPEQKKKYLPALSTGERVGALAIFENGPGVGAGSDAVIARKTSDGYVLSGRKAYVVNVGAADLYVAFACTDPALAGKSMTAFLIEGNAPGVRVGVARERMGLRGCQVADVTLDNVAVGDANVLGKAAEGSALAAETLAASSIAEAAQTVGIAQSALENAAKYAKQRVQFGRPIATLQAIQTMLAETAVNCHLGRLAIYDAAALVEQKKPFATEAAIVKLFAARIREIALVDAVQVEGGYGYSEEMPLARLFRDLSGTSILESPTDFPEEVIAASIA